MGCFLTKNSFKEEEPEEPEKILNQSKSWDELEAKCSIETYEFAQREKKRIGKMDLVFNPSGGLGWSKEKWGNGWYYDPNVIEDLKDQYEFYDAFEPYDPRLVEKKIFDDKVCYQIEKYYARMDGLKNKDEREDMKKAYKDLNKAISGLEWKAPVFVYDEA